MTHLWRSLLQTIRIERGGVADNLRPAHVGNGALPSSNDWDFDPIQFYCSFYSDAPTLSHHSVLGMVHAP